MNHNCEAPDAIHMRRAEFNINLSVIIPAYNEELNIGPVLEETLRGLSAALEVGIFEIIVVNDGSRDGTGARAEEFAARHANIRVLHHPVNRGIGAALKTGYAAARGCWVTATCADGEADVTDVVALLKLTQDVDLVVSRRQRQPGSAWRQLFTRGFHAFTTLLVGFNLSGMEGLYVIRRDLLERLALRSNTSLLNLEIIMQCVSSGCRIACGEIHVRPRLSGQSKMATWRSILKVVSEMVKFRWALVWAKSRQENSAKLGVVPPGRT